MIASIPWLQSALNFFLNRILIEVFPKYLNCSNLSEELLLIFIFCPFWSRDMTVYLVLSACTSRQTPYIDDICAFNIESCTCYTTKGWSGGIAPLIFNLVTRWRWVVRLVPWQRIPVINWIGVWVDHSESSMDVWKTVFTTNWRKYSSPVRQRVCYLET